jgi:hypothetical protein
MERDLRGSGLNVARLCPCLAFYAMLACFCGLWPPRDCLGALEVYGSGMQDPQELAFDSRGNLYVGHSLNARDVTIYRIPAGGGAAVAWPSTGTPFDDADGLDVDLLDQVWSTTGLWANVQDGEVVRVSSDGTATAIGSNYLRNPTSLEIDRQGRFGPKGSVLVANQSTAAGGPEGVAEILSVVENPFDVKSIFQAGDYNTIRCLSFDADDTLWFIGGQKLYRWSELAAGPEEFVLPGVTDSVSALGVDPFNSDLVIGLKEARSVVSLDLDVPEPTVKVLATGLDPAAFAFDAQGRIYVSDEESDVVWVIPEPSTLLLLGMGGLLGIRRRGIP